MVEIYTPVDAFIARDKELMKRLNNEALCEQELIEGMGLFKVTLH